MSELYIINRKLKELLKATGISVYEMEVGSYITSQEMAGASITLFKLDQELKHITMLRAAVPVIARRRKNDGYDN